MNRLLAANFARVIKSKLFWILCGVMAFIALATVLEGLVSKIANIDAQICNCIINLEIVTAVFVSIFFGTEYGDGTIRNKLVVGHSRKQIYLANLITAAVCTVGFAASFMLPIALIGFPCFGLPSATAARIMAAGFMTLLAYCSLFIMINMIYSNKAGATVINLVLTFALLIIGTITCSALLAPEYFPVYGVEEGMVEYTANPSYASGAKRILLQILSNLSPGGQTAQFSLGLTSPLWSLPLYSAGVCAVCTTVGMIVFDRKDIK